MENETILLNHLDKPLRFLGINKDETLSLMLPLMGGIFMGYVLTGFILGVSSLSALRTLKKQHAGVKLIHGMYWHFPSRKSDLKLPVPSYIREYIG